MGKSAVRVFIRTRPTAGHASGLRITDDHKSIAVELRKKDEGAIVNNQLEKLSFKFETILDGTNQEGVFLQTTQELCDNALMGYNGTVFTYGQTGAGKTYTIAGDTQRYDQRGIIPRAVHYLFNEIDLREDREVTVRCSYLEIYNEVMYDLLSENPGTTDNLVVVDDNGVTQVKGLGKKLVANEEETLAAFFQGENLRSTASHTLNSNSSRSHVVFTVHLEIRSGADEKVMYCKINFVDLAGSERTKKSGVAGQTLKEAMYINRSLSFLEQTVNSLSRKEAHVPFRQTKLTAVLRDALGGNCKTVMIGCVWGEDDHMEETVSTLRFAARVKTLMTDTNINQRNDPTMLLRKYERQIAELKQELAMRDTLSGRHVSYEDLGDLEKTELRQMVEKFLKGENSLEDMQVLNLKQIKETYNQFKSVHQTLQNELARQSAHAATHTSLGAGEGEDVNNDLAGRDNEEQAVGDADAELQVGFQVGQAPGHLRPELGDDIEQQVHGALSPSEPNGKAAAGVVNDKHTAFESYKRSHEEGHKLSALLKTLSFDLKDKKAKLKECVKNTNEAKKQIDDQSTTLQVIQNELINDAGDGKSEEQHVMQMLRKFKADYRASFTELKELKEDIRSIEDNLNSTRAQLVSGFESWYSSWQHGSPVNGESSTIINTQPDGFDQEEQFDRMNMERIMLTDPESSAFHAARKALRRKKAAPTVYHGGKGRAQLNRKLELNETR